MEPKCNCRHLELDRQFSVRMSGKDIDKITTGQLRNKLVNSIKEYHNSYDIKFFNITDLKIRDLIINTYAKSCNRQILACTTAKPNTIMEIIFQCDEPQTTVYRKIADLIEDGFLIQVDCGQKETNKKINRYMATFKTVHLDIFEDGNISIKVQFSDIFKSYNNKYWNMNKNNYNLSK
jgi:hypothetical protein